MKTELPLFFRTMIPSYVRYKSYTRVMLSQATKSITTR